jgi:cytochrome d ubiquinol oxidase subunit II
VNTAWFIVLAGMLVAYAVLDGFDLGVGSMHFLTGRTSEERGRAVTAIGPVWNGNEVFLIAAGGALVVAFPRLYASAFSGFYLALMLVLWLLIGRGAAIELRHQIHDPLWEQACDVVFSVSSALLAVLFGVALANVLRGVPFGPDGHFVGSFALLLNPFAIVGGILSLAALSMHGASYLAMKTDGPQQARARRWARGLRWVFLVLVAVIVVASFGVRPGFLRNFVQAPWLLVLPVGVVVAFVLHHRALASGKDEAAFRAGALVIAALLATVFAGLYPMLLPALGAEQGGLDIYNAAAPPRSLRIAFAIYLVGMLIVAVYLVRIYRVWRGPVAVGASYHA